MRSKESEIAAMLLEKLITGNITYRFKKGGDLDFTKGGLVPGKEYKDK